MTVNQKEKRNLSGSRRQNENPEDAMERIIEELESYVCDELCRFCKDLNEEQLEKECENCRIGTLTRKIMEEYDAINDFEASQLGRMIEEHKKIVLCKKCVHRAKEREPNCGTYYWCRNDEGLDGNLGDYDGCSRGMKI